MTLFAGIDAGQSGTVAVIGDAEQILGRGEAGAADEIAQTSDSTRLHDALSAAYQAAARDAHLPADAVCARVVAGVSGYEGRVYGRAPELPCSQLILKHDAIIAQAGAFGGDPGVIVIAGTGSVAYGANDRGQTLTVGGWGYLFGDQGSAFWLARSVLSDAIRDEDRGRSSVLGASALAYFNQPALHALARAFYAGEITRTSLAGYAKEILSAASRGDDSARAYLCKAAADLADLGALTAERLEMPDGPVAFTAGLMKSALMRKETGNALRERAPSIRLVEPRYDAATGALLLARRS